MRRIAIGVTTGLAVWFGSALAAEAQGITPNGPTAVVAGSLCSTYTATVYLPTPCAFRLRLWVKNGSTEVHYSETVYLNPGTNYYNLSKIANHNPPNTGDVLYYTAKIKVGTVWYDASEVWDATVTATRPPTKSSAIQKSTPLAIQSIDRDRRRE